MFDLDAAAPLAAALSMLLVGFFVGMLIGLHMADDHMTEAYNLGFAQECLGKAGYYFTCEEENE